MMDQISPSYKDRVCIAKYNDFSIKNLGNEFYFGMRNELNLAKLNALAEMAKKIREPELFGTYIDEAHFVETYSFFLKTTEETRHRGIFFLREIFFRLSHKNSLLDVGAASGEFTKWIASKFREITIIDTNKAAIDIFNRDQKIIRKSAQLKKIYGSILDVSLKDQSYDLGVLSHVFYYISSEKWIEATEKVYRAVKNDGLLAIVLNGDGLDKYHLINHFNGRFIDIDGYIRKCFTRFPSAKIEVFSSSEVSKTVDILSMLHIVGFFLYDVGAVATKEELMEYINKYLKKADKYYEISFPQKFILIQK